MWLKVKDADGKCYFLNSQNITFFAVEDLDEKHCRLKIHLQDATFSFILHPKQKLHKLLKKLKNKISLNYICTR